MISKKYESLLPPDLLQLLLKPVTEATAALCRLDERIARSTAGAGLLERQNYADACVSRWLDGELVHLEDLVLHDAGQDVRTLTHELTIARDVLHSRRRIASQPSNWALSPDGLHTFRRAWPGPSLGSDRAADTDAVAAEPSRGGAGGVTRGMAVRGRERDQCLRRDRCDPRPLQRRDRTSKMPRPCGR